MALREIHLHGKLAQKYGSTFKLDVTSPSQALRALSVQLDGFEEDLKEGAYRVVRGDLKTGFALKADELDIGLGRKDLHIVPTPLASGVEVIIIVGLTLVAAVGLSLALMPTIEAPDPNSREGAEQRNSGVFDGPVNVTEQGHPVPLVFGTMRVGSVVGAASIDTSDDRPNYVDNGGGGSGYGGSYGTGGFIGDLLDQVYNQLQKGGKGGGSTRAAEEVPNSLQSNATAKIIDIVSEGEIGGLVDGLKSVYLDDTPVQNDDDTFNFQGFALDERLGLPDQPFVMGFSSVEASSALGTEISVASGAVESTITTTTIDRIRVTLGVRAFYSQDTENGDIEETAATVAIDVKEDGGSFAEVGRMTFDGKTNDQYQRSFTFVAPKTGNEAPWTVRARRITPDSTSSALQNATYFDVITELTDVKMTYPDTAYFALTVDAKQFGSQIPTRSYEIKGLKILVPSNYDPETRVYTGVWDGTFKTAWTDNPAWVFYNLLINERWGLGKYINATNVDKFGLYAIAQYCDVMVDDGRGGTEPRFACNAVINTFRDALDLLTALASSFRSMIYWSAGSVMLSQDAPTTVSRIVTPSNVVDGEFNYSNGASYQDQFSAVLVSWNDPNESYRLNTEVVEDPVLVETLGWRPVEITAFGCTSQAMAHRVGLWALEDQKTAGSMVQYIAGFDHADLEPGRVVATSDPRYTTQQLGGRVPSGATTTVVPLDRDVTLDGGETYTLMVMQTDGTVEERTVSTGAGTVSSLTVSSAFPEAAPAGAVWALKSTSVAPREWRIRGAQETEDGEFQMTGALHDSTKYARVETGVSLEPLTFTNLPTGPITPPVDVAILEYYKTEGNSVIPSLTVSVRPPLDDGRVTSFEIQHKRPGTDRWENLGQSSDIIRDVVGVKPGSHEFRARSLDNAGRFSVWVGRSVTVTAQTAALPEVSNPQINTRDAEMTTILIWDAPTDVRPFKYEILFHASSTDINDAAVVGFTEETFTPISFPGNVWVRTAYMDQRSPSPVRTEVTTADFPTVPRDSIDPATITELEDATSAAAANAAAASQNATDIATNASDIAQEVVDRAAAVSAEATARATAISAEATARADAINDEAAARATAITDSITDRLQSMLAPVNRDRVEISALDPEWDSKNSSSMPTGTPANEVTPVTTNFALVNNSEPAIETSVVSGLYAMKAYVDQAGRRYRWRCRVRCTTDASGAEPNRILWRRRRYDEDWNLLSTNSTVVEEDLEVADGWQEFEYEHDAVGDGTTRYVAVGIQCNRGSGSSAAGSTTEIAWVVSEDITDYEANNAAILSEASTRSTETTANADAITALTATVATNTAAVATNATAIADEASARATEIRLVQAKSNMQSMSSIFTFYDDFTDWWDQSSSDPAGSDNPPSSNGFEIIDDSDGKYARVLVPAAGVRRCALRAIYPNVDGKRYKLTVQVRYTGSAGLPGAACSLFGRPLDDGYSYSGTVLPNNSGSSQITIQAQNVWEEHTIEVECDGTTPWWRPDFYIRSDWSGDTSEYLHIRSYKVEELGAGFEENEAAVVAEALARTTATDALASDITTLQATTASNTASISTNATAISNETSARTSAITALQATVDAERYLNYNADFELGKQGWSSAYTADGIGADFPTSDAFGFIENSSSAGNVLQVTGYAYLASSTAIKLAQKPGQGRRIRYRALVRTTVDTSNGNDAAFAFYYVYLDEQGDYISAAATSATVLTVADDWTEITLEFNTDDLYAPNVYVRPMFIIGGNGSGSQSNATMQIAYFYVEDIDDVYEEGQARASAVSALDARVTATEAFASDITTLQTDLGTAQSDIITNATAISTEESARASQALLITSSFGQLSQGALIEGTPDPEFVHGLDYFGDGTYNDAGATPAVVEADGVGGHTIVEVDGKNVIEAEGYEFMVTSWARKLQAGNVTRYKIRCRVTVDATNSENARVTLWVLSYDASWNYQSVRSDTIPFADLTVADGWVEGYVDLEDDYVLGLGGVYTRVMALYNGRSSANADSTTQISYLGFEDVTDAFDNAASAAQALSETSTNATAISANASSITSLDARLTTAEGVGTTNAANISTNATAIADETSARATAISALTATSERAGNGKFLNYNANMMDGSNGWTVKYGSAGSYEGENRGQTDNGMSAPVVSNSSSGRGLDFDSAGAAGANSAWLYSTRVFKIDPTRKYRVRGRYLVGTPGTANTAVYTGIVCLDSSYNYISGGAGTHRYGPGPIAASDYSNGDIIEFDWIISGTGDTAYEFRAGTDYARVMGIANYNGGDSRVICLELSVEDVTSEQEINDTLSASITAEETARVSADAALTAVTDVHQSRFVSEARAINRTMTFDDPTMWSNSATAASGQKDNYSDPSSDVTTVDGSPAWQRSNKTYIGPRYAIRCTPNQKIEVKVRGKVVSDGSRPGSTIALYAYQWQANGDDFITTMTFNTGSFHVAADGTFEVSGEATTSQSAGGAFWFRPYAYINTSDANGEDATVAIFSMEINQTDRLASAEADIITNATTIATESSARAEETNLLRARMHSSNASIRLTFEDGFEDWNYSRTGDPLTPVDPTEWTHSAGSSDSKPYAYAVPDGATFQSIAARPVFPNIDGRKYRVRARVKYTGATGFDEGALGLFGRKLENDYTYEGSVLTSTRIDTESSGTPGNLRFSDTSWHDFEIEIECDGTSPFWRPQLYVRGDWPNPDTGAQVRLKEIFIEEVTPALTEAQGNITTAQADIITNASAIATETSARATQVSALRAQVSHTPGNIVYNPAFERWEDGSGYPAGWKAWTTAGGTISKETSIVPAGQTNAIRCSATSAANLGLEITSYNDGENSEQGIVSDPDITSKYLIECDMYLVSGDWNSVGLYINWRNSGGSVAVENEEVANFRSGLTTGQWYRFSWLAEENASIAGANLLRFLIMVNWSGFGGESVKELIVGNCRITPVNDDDDNAHAEILRQATVAASATSAVADDVTALTATVGTNSADILDNATAIATETSARATQFESLSAAYGSRRFGDGEIEGVLDPFWAHGKDYYGSQRYGTSGADFDDVVANDGGPYGTIVDTDRGRALEQTTYNYPFPAAAIKALAGHRYRARFIWRCTVNTSNGNNNQARGYVLAYNSDFTTYSSGVVSNQLFDSNVQVADGWVTGDIEFEGDEIIDAGYLWMRPWLLYGGTSGAQSNATNQLLLIEITDLTENAEVRFLREVLADGSGNYASATLDTSAGAARTFIRMESIDRDGTVDSNVGIGARRIELYNTSGSGSWEKALEVAAGDAVFYGSISAGAGIFFGDGETKWPVALQDKEYSVEDGDVISFGVTFDETPEFTFSAEGLDALATDEIYRLRAVSASGSGFTAELKILTPGTITAVTESTNATTPSGPDEMVAKAETADAYDDVYTFQIDGNIDIQHTDELGGVNIWFGSLSVETWFHDGTSWVQGPTKFFQYADLGITPTHTNNGTQNYSFTNQTFQVTYTGTIRDSSSLGTFGASPISGGDVTNLDQVSYNKQTTSGERTASPGGETCKVLVRPRNVTS